MERVMDRSMGKAYRIKSFLTNFRTKHVHSFLPLIFSNVQLLLLPKAIERALKYTEKQVLMSLLFYILKYD
jgi:hypothetical protein